MAICIKHMLDILQVYLLLFVEPWQRWTSISDLPSLIPIVTITRRLTQEVNDMLVLYFYTVIVHKSMFVQICSLRSVLHEICAIQCNVVVVSTDLTHAHAHTHACTHNKYQKIIPHILRCPGFF